MTTAGAGAPPLDYARLRAGAVIYADYRTGSHLLKLTLGPLAALDVPRELFGVRPVDAVAVVGRPTVLTFREAVSQGVLDLSQVLLAPRAALAAFLALAQGALARPDGAAQPMLIDLKYDQAFTFGAEPPGVQPVILSALVELGLPVIHVVRRDAVAQAVSQMVAMETGVFLHRSDDSMPAADPGPVWLDPVAVLAQARAHRHARAMADAQLRHAAARTQTVFFEDMAQQGLAVQMRRCLRFLDRWATVPDTLSPPTRAQRSTARVANLSEVIEYALAADPDLVGHIPG